MSISAPNNNWWQKCKKEVSVWSETNCGVLVETEANRKCSHSSLHIVQPFSKIVPKNWPTLIISPKPVFQTKFANKAALKMQ